MTTPKDHIKVSCNIDLTLNERLENLAKSTGRPKSFYIRQALYHQISYLEKLGKEHSVSQFVTPE